MGLSYKIDWMTLTKNKWEVETSEIDNTASALAWAHIALNEIGLWIPELRRRGGQRFYPWIFEDVLTGAVISIPADPSVQGIMVVFSGSTLSEPQHALRVLSCALDHNWRATRIDIAVDIIAMGFTPDNIREEYLKNVANNQVVKSWIEGKTGNTFTIGSRHSNRYIRIYDKGGEQKTDFQWCRVECEYKGQYAVLAGERLCRDHSGVLSDLSAYFEQSVPLLSLAISQLAEEPPSKFKLQVRVQSDRERWFHSQVLSAFRTWADDDYDAASAWLSMCRLLLDEGI